MSCPACGKRNIPEMGVHFPTDSARFARYCLNLQIEPKKVDRKALICFEHFDPKDHIKSGNKVTGVSRVAIPMKIKRPSAQKDVVGSTDPSLIGKGSIPTLDQLLAQNVGFGIASASLSAPTQSSSSSAPSLSSLINNPYSRPTTIVAGGGTPEIGIFGFPRSPQAMPTKLAQAAQPTRVPNLSLFAPQTAAQFSPSRLNALVELAQRTIVISRYKRTGTSPTVTVKYFQEWLLDSFNLPPKAIHDHSQILYMQNYHVIFMVLDEMQTLEGILTMYRSAPPNTYQCLLDSAETILLEGTSMLKRQKGGEGVQQQNSRETNLEEGIDLLLESRIDSNGGAPVRSQTGMDEIVWKNVAAAMMPIYRNMIASNSPQTQQNQISTFAAAMMNSSSANAQQQQQTAPTIANMMRQIDQITRQAHQNGTR